MSRSASSSVRAQSAGRGAQDFRAQGAGRGAQDFRAQGAGRGAQDFRAQGAGRGAQDGGASAPLPPAPRPLRPNQEGFTLAALIVILTIMSIIIAYTVPTQWSLVLRRERERQTIFLMKQYAIGIANWERKHQGLPVTLEQLQDARQPRMLRGTGKWANPLTGNEDDWVLVPPNAIEAVAGGGALPSGGQPGIGVGNAAQGAGGPSKLNPAASPKDYVGPFVAVRPGNSGKSLLVFNGAEDYEKWIYTLQDLKTERQNRQMMMSQPR